ncbi:MAG TPA: TPM domain-containing protein [Candidatus Tectomicrobia bacterium]|nr:TPM domain-containing protein [Candidatus Tectomicrobia bacterium]
MPPAPTARVNDYARLLGDAERQRLEATLAERERATGAQMVIAIFPSLEGEDLEDFSIRLAEQWRIGQKGLDNGVILLVFVQDRRMRMEVGYGLEPVLTDLEAGQIIREAVAPRFRQGRWAEGLHAAIDAVFARVTGERVITPRPGGRPDPATLALLGVVGVIVLVAALEAMSARRRARRQVYSTRGRGWQSPSVVVPPWIGGGWGGGGRSGGWSGGSFSGGGGRFGGGGASGSW